MWKMLNKSSNMLKNRSGQSLILVVLFLPVMLGMAAAGVTVGTIYYAKTNLQNAVDAAALAGAKVIADGNSSAPANQAFLVSQNDSAAQNISVQIDPNFINAVEATASESVPGGFAGIFGYHKFTVTAKGVATYGPGPAFDYAVFQGNKGQLNFNGPVNSDPGSIHSNGSINMDGSSCVVGGITVGESGSNMNGSFGGQGCAQGFIENGQIPLPQWTLQQLTPKNAITISNPGNYPSGTALNGNYVIDGNGGTVNFNGSLTINGDVLVENGSVNVDGGLTMNGSLTTYNGSINLNGSITQMSPNSGVAIAALGSSGNTENINYDGHSSFTGAIYAPDGAINFNGSIGHKNSPVVGAVIAQQINFDGSVNIQYDSQLLKSEPVQQVTLVQ